MALDTVRSVTMAIWPFRRRRKRTRKVTDDGTNIPDVASPSAAAAAASSDDVSSAVPARRDSKRRKRNTVQGTVAVRDQPQTPVSSPPRRPFRAVFTSHSSSDLSRPPLRQPQSAATFHHPPPVRPRLEPGASQTSLALDQYPVPTLHVKKTRERNVLRRRSNKYSDREREQMIKKLATRPAAGHDQWDEESAEAIKISAFDALTPRPMLRYRATAPVPIPGRSISRTSTTKGKQPIIHEAPATVAERVNGLAEQLDATALRELLERDRRRSMKSRGANEVLQKKLQRQVEQVEQVDREPDDRSLSGSWLRDASKENLAASKKPEQETTRADWPLSAPPVATSSRNQSVAETINKTPLGSAPNLPATAKLPASQPPQAPQFQKVEKSAGGGGQFSRLSGIFRRASARMKKPPVEARLTPLTIPSRESIGKANRMDIDQMPSVPPQSGLRGRASHSTSRFIEHLNDFPMPPTSPPSAVSPQLHSATGDRYSGTRPLSVNTGGGDTMNRYSVSLISSRDARDEFGRGTHSPEQNRPDSVLLAQSLASVDSEGSWLSGKPSRRLSHPQFNAQRSKSACSTGERLVESSDEEEEDEAGNSPLSEIFGPLALQEEDDEPRHRRTVSDISTQTVRGQLHDEPSIRAGVARRPQLISPPSRAKSTEGLFTNYQETTPEYSPVSPIDVEAEIHRATSIDLGRGHARHLSAGSAILLDLTSRRPSEAKTATSKGSADENEG